MDMKLLNILRCPSCRTELSCYSSKVNLKGRVVEGNLTCKACSKHYPIVKGIPRFVPMENYAKSFGYQWNLYKYTQVDKFSKNGNSENRFFAETGWTEESMKGKWVLDAGCGNGRFVEICSRTDCEIVGVDISSAIDAAGELFQDKENVHLVQASIYELPFAAAAFDKCYCIGVIQHTPNPKKSIQALPVFVKKGGDIALTIYENKPWTKLYGKYWLRPITKRINKKILLFLIKLLSPILFPVTEILFRVPVLKRIFKFIIPYANYVDMPELSSVKKRYEWAILDTFDMLSPAYDKPMTEKAVRQSLALSEVVEVKRLPNPGVNVIAQKA